jgi:hypothetical protein
MLTLGEMRRYRLGKHDRLLSKVDESATLWADVSIWPSPVKRLAGWTAARLTAFISSLCSTCDKVCRKSSSRDNTIKAGLMVGRGTE